LEKIKTIIIISLSLILFIIISVFFAWFFISTNAEKKQTKENKIALEKINEQMAIRDKKIKELIDNPILITKEKLVNMTTPEKDQAIMDLQNRNTSLEDIIKQDTFMIESLKNDLKKTNDILITRFIPKHGFSVFGLVGIDKMLAVDVYTGVIYKRYFLDGRLYFGGGLGIKPYKELGGSIIIEIGFTF
jgi:uncharacterized protein YneF (UPF0154 family)